MPVESIVLVVDCGLLHGENGGLNPSRGSLALDQHADGVSRSPGGLEPSCSSLVPNQHAYGVVS